MSAVPETAWIPHGDVERLREAREILRDEGQAILDVAKRLDAGFCAAVQLLRDCRGAVVVTGMGKAGHVGRKLSATLASTGTRSHFLHPAEAVHGDLGSVSSEDLVLALSHSGETDELNRILPRIKTMGATLVAITASEESTLGRHADVTIALGKQREVDRLGLAPSTSTTVMLAVGDALALVVSHERGFTRQQFAFNHPAGALGRKLCRVSEVMRCGDQLRTASATQTVRDVFVNRGRPGRRTGAVILVDNEGVLVGLFTDSDLVRLLETHRENQVNRPISEVMTANPRTIRPDALLGDAVELLAKHHISELPVVDDRGHPVGLIDITDVIGLVPEVG